MKLKEKNEKKKKISKFKKYQLLITLLITIVCCANFVMIYKLNIIPLKYILLYSLLSILLIFLSIFIFFKKKRMKFLKVLWAIIVTITTIVLTIGFFYLHKTNTFMSKIDDLNHRKEKYNVIVLKDSNYESVADIKNSIEYISKKSLHYDNALEELNKLTNAKTIEMNDDNALVNNLYNKKTDAILTEETNYNILLEKYPQLSEKVKVLYTFEIKIETNNIVKDTKNNEPFNIYVTGLDNYGSIDIVSRSDVNMVITVNPNTNQVLITSIPRDYYVQLKDTTGYKDKLTHAGIYGVESSVGTIENLFDIDINYYVKANFTTVVSLIDAIGGIDVYNERSFTGHLYTYFPEGYVHLNGEQALEFARTRKTLPNGDNDRIKNQQAIIDGVIKKVTSPQIITKYTGIINSLSSSFRTNMSTDKITYLIKNQIDKMPKWNITSNVVTGSNGYEYTYSYQSQKLYVMIPNEDSIQQAKDLIKKTLNGEILDASYSDATNVSNPTKGSAPQPVTTPKL